MKLKSLLVIVAISAFCLSVSACSNFISSSSVMGTLTYTDTGVNKPDDFPILRASGYAIISAQKGPKNAQKAIQAMRASKVDAYRELSEQVFGIYVNSQENITNSVLSTEQLRSEVSGLVHGARVVRQYPVGDTYITELELDTKLLYDMYQFRGAF